MRLNGFLILENFLVHGDRAGQPRTEIDMLGIRCQWRREHLIQPMKDDDWIEKIARTIVIFCDAKKGPEDLNRSWANRERQTMESFLALVGVADEAEWPKMAAELYEQGFTSTAEGVFVTTLLIHHDPNQLVCLRWPQAPKIQISAAIRFIFERFAAYSRIKLDHGQWRPSGHRLWDLYENHDTADSFVARVMSEL